MSETLKIQLIGPLTYANSAARLQMAAAAQAERVEIDMRRVQHIDAFGIGQLLTLKNKLEQKQGHLRIQGTQRVVYETLHLLNHTEIIEVIR